MKVEAMIGILDMGGGGRGRGRGGNFRGHGRGGYNGPQMDVQQDAEDYNQEAPRGRGRGSGPHGWGRGDHPTGEDLSAGEDLPADGYHPTGEDHSVGGHQLPGGVDVQEGMDISTAQFDTDHGENDPDRFRSINQLIYGAALVPDDDFDSVLCMLLCFCIFLLLIILF
ncbi:hypothetical protein OROGR_032771 [Orobanche gracilis]